MATPATATTRIICLTEAGLRLAKRLQAAHPDWALDYKPKPFKAHVQQAFQQGERLLCICATGIAMRTLAPVLVDKYQDPPVLVLDELGQYVIPLLSGHEGGANDWAAELAQELNASAVITTAKPYLAPVYTVGMGCERHCPEDELARLLDDCLAKIGLHRAQIHSLNSIDIKHDEVGLIELGQTLNKPFQTFSVAELSPAEPWLNSRSEYVFNTVGVYGVAESAALIAAQQAANNTQDVPELVLIKHKTAKATCAIARAYPQFKNPNATF